MTIQQFKEYLIKTKTSRGKYRKKRTVDLHIQLFTRLAHFCPDLTVEQISTHLTSLYESGCKGTYINDYIDTLHLYGRCIDSNIYDQLTYYPEEEFIQETLSDEEIKSFLALPAPTITRYDPRQKKTISYVFDPKGYDTYTLFFSILAYTGMRPGECAHLTIDDVNFGQQVFKLLPEHVKTNEYRLVPIPVMLIPALKEYIANLRTGSVLLFESRRGNGTVMDSTDWGYQFHARLKRLGIKRKNLRPSSLRPSFITRMLGEDISISKVQKIVGHKQITTTAHYTHHTTKDMINTIKKDPLARSALTSEERIMQLRSVIENIGLFVSSMKITDNGYIIEVLQ